MVPVAILGRYARSLAEVAFEKNSEDRVAEGLKTFAEIIQAAPEIQEIFGSPAIPRETRERLLDELLVKYPVDPTAANFLHVLLEHNRMHSFKDILDAFLRLMNERKGIVTAKVTTASPLAESELEKIAARLGKIAGKLVTVEPTIDEELLGGMVVNIGSTIYDGSVRTRLAEMRRRLADITKTGVTGA